MYSRVPCSIGLAMLASAKQAPANPCANVFSQACKNPAPSPQYAAIHALQLCSKQEAAVTGRSNGHHQDQYSRQRHGDTFSGLWTSYHTFHVFLHISKRLSTLNIDFSRNTKTALRQEFNLFSMQKKKQLGNSLF